MRCARLARLLLDAAPGDMLVRQSWLTHSELAALLGTVPDVLNRALRILANAGLIRVEWKQITIVDRAGPAERAIVFSQRCTNSPFSTVTGRDLNSCSTPKSSRRSSVRLRAARRVAGRRDLADGQDHAARTAAGRDGGGTLCLNPPPNSREPLPPLEAPGAGRRLSSARTHCTWTRSRSAVHR